MSRMYGFRLSADDDDLESILENLNGKERSSYIKAAIRFYNNYGGKISEILNGVEKILSVLEGMKFTVSEDSPGKSLKNPENNQTEDILINSIRDLLNL